MLSAGGYRTTDQIAAGRAQVVELVLGHRYASPVVRELGQGPTPRPRTGTRGPDPDGARAAGPSARYRATTTDFVSW